MAAEKQPLANIYVKESSLAAVAIVKIGQEEHEYKVASAVRDHGPAVKVVLKALKHLPDGAGAAVFMDLEYIVKAMHKEMRDWEKRNLSKQASENSLAGIPALRYEVQRLGNVLWQFEPDAPQAEMQKTLARASYWSNFVREQARSAVSKPSDSWSPDDWTKYWHAVDEVAATW